MIGRGDGWPAVVLAWSCLVLLPVGRLVEVPVLLMAACGVWLLVREGRRVLAVDGVRLLTGVFLAVWLPILLSLPDAVNLQRSGVVAVNHLRFFFAGVFMVWTLSSERAQQRLLTLSGLLLGFWVLDAYVQILFGADLFGREPWLGGTSALFGAGSSKFGTSFGVIAGLLWAFTRRAGSPWLLAGVVLASGFVVMTAGSRAAWVSLLVVLCVYAWGERRWIRGLGARVLVPLAVLAIVLPVVAYQVSEPFKRRFDQSFSELSGQVAVQQSPLGHRAWIWKGAVNMIADNPINGVGARGFRYAFTTYAAPGDPFLAMDPPMSPTHSHHVLLEVAAETGLLGIVGLLWAAWLLLRAGRGGDARARARELPYAAALIAAFFPLNTHLAIYSAHWSQQVWWLLAVYCAAIAARGVAAPVAPRDVPAR